MILKLQSIKYLTFNCHQQKTWNDGLYIFVKMLLRFCFVSSSRIYNMYILLHKLGFDIIFCFQSFVKQTLNFIFPMLAVYPSDIVLENKTGEYSILPFPLLNAL